MKLHTLKIQIKGNGTYCKDIVPYSYLETILSITKYHQVSISEIQNFLM
jgi:hypothetical protein